MNTMSRKLYLAIILVLGGCSGASPTIVATSSVSIPALALDAELIFWVDRANGEVRSTRKDGKGEVTTLASMRCNPFAVAVDKEFVYWLDIGGGFPCGVGQGVVSLARAPRNGGLITELRQEVMEARDGFLVAGDQLLYWGTGNQGPLWTTKKVTGETVRLTDRAARVAIDPARVCWTSGGVVGADGSVTCTGQLPPQPQVIAQGLANPSLIAIAGDSVLWTETGNVRIISSRAKNPEVLYEHASIVGLINDGDLLYLTDGTEIGRIDLAGSGKFATIYREPRGQVEALVVDDRLVYWSNAGRIKSFPKLP